MAEECSIGVGTSRVTKESLWWTNRLTKGDIWMIKSLREKESEYSGSNVPPKINLPPINLNVNHENYFKPKEMSIGPLVKHNLGADMKRKLAAKFVNSCGKTAANLLLHIKNNIHDLNKLFPENSIRSNHELSRILFADDVSPLESFFDGDDYELSRFLSDEAWSRILSEDDDVKLSKILSKCDDEELSWIRRNNLSRMLLVDGCAVLQFIFSYVEKELKDFNINNGQAEVIRQDLFILGNQIPFRVLNILFDLISDDDKAHQFRVSVFKFVLGYNITEQMDNYEALSQPEYLARFYEHHEPVHLLGLLHSIFVYGGGLYEHLIPISEIPVAKDRRIFYSSYERSFRNVQELKEAGIKVTPSDFNGLNSVHFASKFFVTGQVKFPPLIVDNSTEQKLLNLVAYEMTCDDYESKNCWVVSYVNILDLLIDSEQDVKDLRAARVLRNRLSNDAEVAQLFNKLGSSCSAPPRDEYAPLKNKLQRHYERKSAVWVAQVYHDQFRSPWTVLALIAAVIALLLTGIQTWYAVNPKN